jgi:uncharacterized protein YbjT (DUF2867 family)
MKIVVIGGAGMVGRLLVAALRERGHEALAASRATGVDAQTGAGLADALAGADAVVDVTNPPDYSQAETFFRTATQRLLDAEVAAGVRHHLILSIVGIDRIPGNAYYRAKLAQEETAQAGAVPLTILRATQFFEFARGLADRQGGDPVRAASTILQPVAVADVVAELAALATAERAAGLIELAGPERIALDDFIRRAHRALGDPRTVLTDETAELLRVGPIRDALAPVGDAARIAPTTLDEWAARQQSRS